MHQRCLRCKPAQLGSGSGAAYNVRINLPGIKDEEFVQQAQSRMEEPSTPPMKASWSEKCLASGPKRVDTGLCHMVLCKQQYILGCDGLSSTPWLQR